MEYSDKKKIQVILDYTKKSVTDFAKELGVHRQTINQVLGERNGLSKNLAKKIYEVYDINYEWLVYGTGEMINTTLKKSDRIAKIISELHLTIDQFCDRAGILNKQRFSDMINKGKTPNSDNLVRILNTYKFINPVWLMSGEGETYRPLLADEETIKEKEEIISLYRDKVKLLEEKVKDLTEKLNKSKTNL